MVANELFLFLSLFQNHKLMGFNLFYVLPTITNFFLMLKMSHFWPAGALLSLVYEHFLFLQYKKFLALFSCPRCGTLTSACACACVSARESLSVYRYKYHIIVPFNEFLFISLYSFWNQILKTKGAFILTQSTQCLTHFCAAGMADSVSQTSTDSLS